MSNSLDPSALLTSNDHRLVLEATLAPASGLDRFQPAGFPEIGHVIYDAPRTQNTVEKVCIVDSAASMANHLESVCHANAQSLEIASELTGMPYVECLTDDGWPEVTVRGPHRLVVTTLSEGHRLASTYFLEGFLVENSRATDRKLGTVLRDEFGIVDLGKRSHPLPEQWWRVFSTIFQYDPNSLVHGILFTGLGIKLPRVLTAHLEAFGAGRVGTSGVKFDKLGKTTSGQPIFAVDEETATEIRATFVIDLAFVRSFGRNGNGLTEAQKQFLLALSLWKIQRLLSAPFRYRSNCDLELDELKRRRNGSSEPIELAHIDIADAIQNAGFEQPLITKVYWSAKELFRLGEETTTAPGESAEDETGEEEQ